MTGKLKIKIVDNPVDEQKQNRKTRKREIYYIYQHKYKNNQERWERVRKLQHKKFTRNLYFLGRKLEEKKIITIGTSSFPQLLLAF